MSHTNDENLIVSAYVPEKGHKRKLRIEAAKRGMSLSKYAGLLLKKATKNYTDFDVGDKHIDNRTKDSDSGQEPD